MKKGQSELLAVSELRIGMYVELDIGWMSHPFATGSFQISSRRQIEAIRSLGLAQVRYFPGKSDAGILPDQWGTTASGVTDALASACANDDCAPRAPAGQQRRHQASDTADDQYRLLRCERRFQEGVALYKRVFSQAHEQPQEVKNQCDALIGGLLDELLMPGDISIRLLSTAGGGRMASHAVNVTVLSLLLGRAMGLPHAELADLGVAAFLHDIGKSMVPERVRSLDDYFSVAEYKLYRDHVLHSVVLGRTLGLSSEVLVAMGQHHEMIDGSGFPRKSKGDELGRLSRILAVVNRYDNLCNPVHFTSAMTPHEALSKMFAQMKGRFDGGIVNALIRVLGVHPPGSIVQLTNERYAMVTATNGSHSLKPRVLIHDPAVPQHERMILDLEQMPDIGIRRGIKPANLPLESADYLLPRQPICYFFDRTRPESLAA